MADSDKKKLEKIANTPSRSDKVSWNRKMDKMINLVAKTQPLEDKILDLMAEKNKIIDEIVELRKVMTAECIHPFSELVDREDHVFCKFCERKIAPINVIE